MSSPETEIGGTIGKFIGNTVGEAAAFAAGVAVGPVLEPLLQKIRNATWSDYPDKPLDPTAIAEIVAQGLLGQDDGATEAAMSGLAATPFAALLQAAQIAPSVSEVLDLWRRNATKKPDEQISSDQVDHALSKAKLESQYWAAVKELASERLDPAVIAVAIQRGIMKDPGFLPVGPPTDTGVVPAFPVSPLDALNEAIASGIDEQRLFVETAIVGNPLSLQEAASAFFRGIIEQADYDRAVAEGNTRNEWGPAALAQARKILSAEQYAELELRGFYDRTTRLANTAQHGMSDGNSDNLYNVLGRSIPVKQITTGLARGGVFPTAIVESGDAAALASLANLPASEGGYSDIPQEYLSALQRGNLRPEYYSLAYANRYTYPSYFVIKPLVATGAITVEAATQIFEDEGWTPALAAAAAASFATSTTATPAGPTKTFTNSAVRAISKSYVAAKITKDQATNDLTTLGVPSSEYAALFNAWDVTRAATIEGLSNAQLRAAYRKGALDEPTTLARLQANGLSQADAVTYLAA